MAAKSTEDLMRDFDPNDPRLGDSYMWATYVPKRGRSGFKMHMGRGPALNAATHVSNYILYRWDSVTSRWEEVCRVEKRWQQTICLNCGLDVKADPRRHYGRLNWFFVGKPTLREVAMCNRCAGYDNGQRGPYYAMRSVPVDQRVFV